MTQKLNIKDEFYRQLNFNRRSYLEACIHYLDYIYDVHKASEKKENLYNKCPKRKYQT